MAKNNRPPRISISIQLEDAGTLQGLIDGSIGTADDNIFVKQMQRVLKQLDKKVNQYYQKKNKQVNHL